MKPTIIRTVNWTNRPDRYKVRRPKQGHEEPGAQRADNAQRVLAHRQIESTSGGQAGRLVKVTEKLWRELPHMAWLSQVRQAISVRRRSTPRKHWA